MVCGLILMYYYRPWWRCWDSWSGGSLSLLRLAGAIDRGIRGTYHLFGFRAVPLPGLLLRHDRPRRPEGFYLGLPLAFLITAILWINEFPDLEADTASAKEHLVARLGIRNSLFIYTGLMLAPFLCLPLLVEIFHFPGHLFAALVALPLAVQAVRQAWKIPPTDEEFPPIQALTIKTHFLMGLALTLAFLYAAWRR